MSLVRLDLYNGANDFTYGEDGEKLAYTGWKLMNGNWYYFDERSQLYEGLGSNQWKQILFPDRL